MRYYVWFSQIRSHIQYLKYMSEEGKLVATNVVAKL